MKHALLIQHHVVVPIRAVSCITIENFAQKKFITHLYYYIPSDPTRIHYKKGLKIQSSNTISCMSNSKVSWHFNNTETLPQNVQILLNPNFLYLSNINENNTGNYECRGKTENGELFHAEVLVVLTIRGNYYKYN